MESPEEASRHEIFWASVRLLVMLLILALVLVPLLRGLPLGQTTRTGLLAWLLVLIVLYWMYAGLGYRSLLLLQLLLFSTAATFLTTKAMLVLVGIKRLSILRRTARDLIIAGAALAAINLIAMVIAMLKQSDGGRSAGPSAGGGGKAANEQRPEELPRP